MKNDELVSNMYEGFVAVGKADERIDNPEIFAGRVMQTMLNFAYDLLDEIASGKVGVEKWIETKKELIKNNS